MPPPAEFRQESSKVGLDFIPSVEYILCRELLTVVLASTIKHGQRWSYTKMSYEIM